MMGCDVTIVGGGPAAFAAALSLASRGLRVTMLAGPDVPWSPNYGTWVDEAEAVGLGGFLGPVWSDAVVVYDDERSDQLGRAYARVAKRRLRASLVDRALRGGVDLRWERAVAIDHDPTGSIVETAEGATIRSAMVVDASGHRPTFVHRDGEPTTFQAAIGMSGTVDHHPWDPTRMTFMDLRTDHLDDELGQAVPTFLYTMPVGPQRVFLEETSLLRAPAVPFGVLHRRLRRRLHRMGVSLTDVDATEMCLIPMDTPLPDLTQRVVGFGGAASFVNPASGYLLGRAFGTAPDLANAIADGLGAGRSPDAVAGQAWRAIWTDDDLLRRELHLFGARILSELDAESQRSFFEAFFSMSKPLWSGYLAPRGDLVTLARAMGTLLLAGDNRLRWKLLVSGRRLPGVLIRAAV